MLLRQFISGGTEALGSLYPPEEARGIVLRLCRDMLGVESYTHVVEPDFRVPESAEAALADAIVRLKSGEPLQYVTGWQEFCGRRFRVSPAVLIPRPETEQLVQAALSRAAEAGEGPLRILDLCTGSGCIAWSLSLGLPSASVTGIDISREALDLAGAQFPCLGPAFLEMDVLDPPDEADGAPFHIITANPPYIRESEKAAMHANVLEHEPHLALFVSDDDPLVFYRSISVWAGHFLAPGGWCITEINEALGDAVAGLFRSCGFEKVRKIRDFFGKERFVSFEKGL